LIVNIAVTMAEKATGIDPEKIVAARFRSSAAAAGPADVAAAAPDLAGPSPSPFSPQQLVTYDIRSGLRDAPISGTIRDFQKTFFGIKRLEESQCIYAWTTTTH